MRHDQSIGALKLVVLLAAAGCGDEAAEEPVGRQALAICAAEGPVKAFPEQLTSSAFTPSGTPVNVSGCSSCTWPEVPQFRFSAGPVGGPYTVFRNWAAKSNAVYSGGAAGVTEFKVDSRREGTTVIDVTSTLQYTFQDKCSDVTLDPTPRASQAAGSPITLTGYGVCGSMPAPQYRFEYKQGSNPWQSIRGWATGSTTTWTPPASGSYQLRVGVRKDSAGQATLKIVPYTVGASGSCGPATQAFTGIAYTSTPSERQRLDLTLPTTGGNGCPMIVWIHGGGWQSGTRTLGPLALAKLQPYLEAGYSLATIDYRLSGDAIFPAQIYDVKAAIRWLRANIGPSYIVAMGSSAGGHLTSLLGTSAGVSSLENLAQGNATASSHVDGFISCFGPADFPAMDNQLAAMSTCPSQAQTHDLGCSAENRLVGCYRGYDTSDALCVGRTESANPAFHLDATDPPALFGHGEKDCVVPYEQTENLVAAYQTAAPQQYVDYQLQTNGKHLVGGAEDGCPSDGRISAFFEHVDSLH
jgi:acetyl esterase/lipase